MIEQPRRHFLLGQYREAVSLKKKMTRAVHFALFFLVIAFPFMQPHESCAMSDQGGPDKPRADPGPNPPWVRKSGFVRAQGVIVFVHGVLGDARSSWTAGTTYWPAMLTQDTAFDGQDIYVYRYPSPTMGRSFSIDEVAENLRLTLSTDGVLRYRTISFVCHSMGGIVVRAFIVKYQGQVANKIRLLYFFATPTTGSPYAALAALISKNPQFGQMYPMNADSYLGPLQSNWLAAHLQLKSYCAYETQPTLGLKVVDMASATHLCTERVDPINANHIDIVKPSSTESTPHRALRSAFEETAVDARTAPPRGNRVKLAPRRPQAVVVAKARSEAVSRWYVRGSIPAVGSSSENVPYLQELFWDWTLSLTATEDLSFLEVVVRSAVPVVDRIRITPENAATVLA